MEKYFVDWQVKVLNGAPPPTSRAEVEFYQYVLKLPMANGRPKHSPIQRLWLEVISDDDVPLPTAYSYPTNKKALLAQKMGLELLRGITLNRLPPPALECYAVTRLLLQHHGTIFSGGITQSWVSGEELLLTPFPGVAQASGLLKALKTKSPWLASL